jgi:beta-lactamase regulating signal transducer with metallopeptidase domain
MNIQSAAFIFLCKWTVLLALAWAAHALLRSRDARWRLILWRSVLCFGLALPLLSFLPVPAVRLPVAKVAQMVSATIILPAPALPDPAPGPNQLAPAVSEVQSAPNPAPVHALQNQRAGYFSTLSWGDILLSIWVAGAVYGSIRLLLFLKQLSTLRRTAMPANSAIGELTAKVLRRFQINRSVPVLVSNSTVSPFAFGILRPAIMLPTKLAHSLPAEEMTALLGHEVAHLRRRDLWWCSGWRWMQALFWFHPLVWKLPDVHSLACEEEADRLASSYMADRASYVRVLAQLALRVLALPEMETQLAVNGTAQITHRLRRLQKDVAAWGWKQTAAASFLVLAMALVSAGCDVSSNQNAQQIQKLEAKVAELEKRLDEMQRAPQQQLTPEQQRGRERMQAYREKYEQRRAMDERTHTPAEMAEVEKAYDATQNNFGSPECIQALKEFIKKYPGFNRTGCALCELGGLTTFGPEAEQYFNECIQKYDNCYWGDGVQVGPFARFDLALDYKNTGQTDKAEALYQEIRDHYSDSLDHRGQLLVDVISK